VENIVGALVGAVVGGLLAIAAGLLAARSARKDDADRRRADRHLELSSTALAALQHLVRATIDVAYVDLPPRSMDHEDSESQVAVRNNYQRAVTEWNAAMYGILVGAEDKAARSVRRIDAEVDRILGLALSRKWDREDFRNERRQLGQLMAEHIDIARSEAKLEPLELGTVWTWANHDAD
jgi:hypothetical protein